MRGKDSVLLTVSVEGTSAELGTEASTYPGRFEVYLVNSDLDQRIIRGEDNLNFDQDGINTNFYSKELESPMVEEIENDKFRITYRLEVLNNPNGEQTLEDLHNSWSQLEIEVAFVKVDSQKNKRTIDVSLMLELPNEVPTNIEIAALHKAIGVTWEGNKEVSFTAAEGDTPFSLKPKNVLVMLFPTNVGDISLNAKELDSESGDEIESSCTFSYASESSSCITCSSDAAFLTLDQAESELFKIALVPNLVSNPLYTFTNLEFNQDYVVTMQYEDGVKRSDCSLVKPITTVSLTEANGEKNAEEGDPRCFIATAAYGHALADEVILLRWFRDNVLLHNVMGKRLVSAYYNWSPVVADVISTSEFLKGMVRILLWPLVIFVGLIKYVNFTNMYLLLISFMLAFYFGMKSFRKI